SFAMPQAPAMPVKALWEMASPEQRERAHQASVVLMEYWLGRITKEDLAVALKVPPLRVWQLSQQAISGMIAGLLIQPKARAPKGAKNMGLMNEMKDPESDPKVLRKKIEALEKTVAMQDRLIAILREMPGCKQVTFVEAERQELEQTKASLKTEHPGGMSAARPKKRGRKPKKTAENPIPAGARHESGSVAQSGTPGQSS